ncbi:MAG TPA: hypothetical protein PKM41_10800 [Deltaproteobacteria bacterium]|nr:hypothetical protein [Deltaproteobacteria bacterium]HOI06422.1 hypothetical protein [Deltaproteobacteria bacterium]
MGTGPVFFRAIRIEMPVPAVYRRLGFRTASTCVTAAQKAGIDQVLDEAASLVELQGSALIIPVRGRQGEETILQTGDVLKSAKLAKMLDDAGEVLFMGATAGQRIMEEIARDSSSENLSRAVLLDAVASEMTDKALDWISEYMGAVLRRTGKILTSRRFSAGYGDLGLENQKIMYERLRMAELGVVLTDSFILVPEKSVTAIAGIRGNVRQGT